MESNASGGARHPPSTGSHTTDTEPASNLPTEERTGLYGTSPAMQRVRRLVALYARSTASTVVVHGETGTGKELVARALHRLGPRAPRPFVAANVAALPENLAESVLFGHERGAFTGAYGRHRGLFEAADRGTLFLDEVAELTLPMQARLLRVLETGEIRALGSEHTRAVSVRLVVATHTPLAPLVSLGVMRADLYFRLNGLVITIPALRERIEDIEGIAMTLLARNTREIGARRLAPEAVHALSNYGWPGNVRQLGNVLLRAAAHTAREVLSARDVSDALVAEPRASFHITEGATIETIRGVLKAHGGRISPSARILGMARSTLRERIRRHAIVLEP